MKCRIRLAVALLVTIVSAGCEKKPEAPDPAQGPALVIRNQEARDWTIWVELARTRKEKTEGLMYRWSLEKDHGMLFIYDDSQVRRFWMKNTRICLDMIFIGPDRRVVGIIENAEPYTETLRAVSAPSRWVLEVKGGEAAAHGVRKGDRVYFFGIEGAQG